MRSSPGPLGIVNDGSSDRLWHQRKDEHALADVQRLAAINEGSVYLQLTPPNAITLMIINTVQNKSHSGDWESLEQVFGIKRVQ